MFAARYHPGAKRLAYEDLPVPEPGPDDVVLAVAAAGICHSDLHVLDGEIGFPGSFTMGHEGAGVLVRAGAEVDRLRLGDLFAVHGVNPCGNCAYCRSGRDNLCNAPTRSWIGLGTDGAYAEYLRVPARNVVPVPAGVDAAVAAIATDAVLTPYHALKTIARVQLSERVLAIGLGGLGLNGVRIARALGGEVIACDIDEEKLKLAMAAGAHQALSFAELSDRVAGGSIDVVADFVASEQSFARACEAVRPGGRVVLVGLASPTLSLPTFKVATAEVGVLGSMWGTSTELAEVLNLIAAGTLRPQVETHPLVEVNDWMDSLRQHRVPARVALAPPASANRPLSATSAHLS